jgi:hypothetical protein
MTSIIYFRDQPDIKNYSFSPPLLNWIKETFRNLSFFDFDTASDRSMAGYAEQLATESCLAILLLDTKAPGSTGMLTNINNYFLDHREKSYVLQISENTIITKLFHPLAEHFLFTEEENLQKEFIRNVLSHRL